MKTFIYLILLLAFTLSCVQVEETITLSSSEFKFKGFDWDPMPYKFGDSISTIVLEDRGSGMAATEFSYIGDEENTLKFWDLRISKPTTPLSQEKVDSFIKQYKPVKAIPYILDKTKDARITIINEEHHMPQTRILTTRLLKDLYEQGYRHLGLETFLASKPVYEAVQHDKYTRLNHGIYQKEPQFGNMIRKALELGFNIFGYESRGHESGKEREINQANNILEYLKENQNGKVLIHCGYAHGAEGEYGGTWERAMAARLTEFSGIDPLTINQTKYLSRSKPSFDDAYYQITDVEDLSVFVDDQDNVFGKYRNDSYFDISVFHPKTKRNVRPSWLLYGKREFVDISIKEEALMPKLLLAYVDHEEVGSAIPYDIQEMKSNKATLALEPGKYVLIFLNPDMTSQKGFIEVKGE